MTTHAVPAARPEPPPRRTYATDEKLLARVLAPYKKHCVYLRAATVTTHDGNASAECEFVIPESCYIDDTGHLNSVEVNICYNQMMYYLVAKCVKEGMPAGFETWTLEDFWKRQLPDILIARFSSSFRRPVNPRSFAGEMEFQSVTRRAPGRGAPFLHAQTSFRYWDTDGGRCDGQATLAFVNIP
ncbi:FcoT family thioesterase [Streptomyces sp. NPDC088124]|uniref:(2E)-enoyl-ACP glycyltransferase n=1 Tax=Streptomyces sp. NPDC088124 TaxID=3154654 RepID=UPI003445ADA4